jgi:cyclophilin family peptidyl-prolyl cis-trans isomerase
MHRTLLHSVLFSKLACAFVACGNDQPKSTADSTASAQSKPADTKAADAKTTTPKSMDAHAPVAKTDAKDGATPAAAPKPDEKKPAADAPKPDAPPDPIAQAKEFIASKNIDKKVPSWRTKVTMPPKLTFDPKKSYFWVLDTTEGPIKVRLMPDIAPMHVSSTIYLTEMGFYDTLKFHRVITGFMAQGGDPLGNGTGGPAYKYGAEFSPKARHTKAGLLSMANSGPNTEGSQFFLTFAATPWLDDKHTIFGEVVEGLDNLKKLEAFGSQTGATSKPLEIRTAKIEVE